jgi:hypothetical protein
MAQFKMPTLNTNQLKLYSPKPVLMLFLKPSSIVAFQLFKDLDEFQIQLEISIDIGESLIESLTELLKKIVGHKSFNRRAKIIMLTDDCYLNFYRTSISINQLNNVHETLELEVDNIDDYEYDVSLGQMESKNVSELLVFMIKKNNLNAIEHVFRSHRLILRQMMSRYHAVTALIDAQIFEFNSNKVTFLIDIGSTRVRLFAISDGVKMVRHMPIRLAESFKTAAKMNAAILSAIAPFIESSIDAYTLKYSGQMVNSIVAITDWPSLGSALKGKKIKTVPVEPIPLNKSLFYNKNVKNNEDYLYSYGGFLFYQSFQKFNVIPFMKRFEKAGLIALLSIFVVGITFNIVYGIYTNYSLKNELLRATKGKATQISDQTEKKREMVAIRNRINNQKKIIDYADLTTESYGDQFRIDDFLFNLTSMLTSDVTLSAIRLRNNRLTLSGNSNSLSGNYSFYAFLQKLEATPELGRIHYSLGMGGGPNMSSFTIEVNLNAK